MSEDFGRRQYDGVASDHDLLVRIDERLTTHLMTFTVFTQESVRDRDNIRIRLKVLEDHQVSEDAASRANARFVTMIIACSSGLTGLVIWSLNHFVK